MNIIIMRHGHAIFEGNDRVLSEEGKNQVAITACKLHAMLKIDRVFSSPKSRAKQTADIVVSKMRCDKPQINIIKDLSPSGNSNLVIDEVLCTAKEQETILLVSHIPLVEDLSHSLNQSLAIPAFETACAYILTNDTGIWTAKALITPYSEQNYS